MKFKALSQDLSAGLTLVTRALPVRSTIELLEGILISIDENGLKFTCSDGAIAIEHYVAAEILEEGRVVVPGRLFFEAMRRLPEGDCVVEVATNYALSIRCAGNRTKISGMSADDYPDVAQVIDPKSIEISAALLKKMISSTVFCAAQEDTRPILTGCLFKADMNGVRMVALDGFRMAICEDNTILGDIEAVIPWKPLNEVARTLPENETLIKISTTQSYFVVDLPGTRMTLRLLEGKFIDYKKILPQDFKTVVIIEKKYLEDAAQRAALIAREAKTHIIRMKIEDECMTISANAELGEIYEEIPINLNGLEISAAFNVKYITEAMRGIQDQHVLIQLNTNVTPCVIIPKEEPGILYLFLPVRVSG